MGYMTDERLMIKETAAQFTDDVVIPIANKLDPEKGMMPRELLAQMAEMGFFGIRAPAKYGGSEMGAFEYCLIAEELSRGWMSVASVIARSAYTLIENIPGWSEAKKQDYCERSVAGDFLVAMALSEPNTGSDLASISCKATREGDEFVLSGSKYWCTFADGADAIIVYARTAEPSNPKRRHEGISCFLVEKPRGALPENCDGHSIPKIGYFGWNTYELAFDGCRVPAENMVGEEGKAFASLASGLEVARAHTASRSIGAHRPRWMSQYSTHTTACSSSAPYPSSRTSASRLRRWPPRSKRHASSTTTCVTKSTRRSLRQRGINDQVVRLGNGRAGHQRCLADSGWCRLHPALPGGALLAGCAPY